jgi:hypothetical protein
MGKHAKPPVELATTEELLAEITKRLYGKTPDELTDEEIRELLDRLDRIERGERP